MGQLLADRQAGGETGRLDKGRCFRTAKESGTLHPRGSKSKAAAACAPQWVQRGLAATPRIYGFRSGANGRRPTLASDSSDPALLMRQLKPRPASR